MIYGIDISCLSQYDKASNMDWPTLKPNIDFAFIKASEGVYTDNLFGNHVYGASTAGIPWLAAYHYIDPEIAGYRQMQHYAMVTKEARDKGQLKAMALDFERGRNKRTGKKYGDVALSCNALACAVELAKLTDLPIIIYTRTSFVNEYSPYSRRWLPGYRQWLAQYPGSAWQCGAWWWKKGQRWTWPQFKIWLEKMKFTWPSAIGSGKCTFWQVTGDRFYLPGHNNKTVDVDLFNGTLDELLAMKKI